MFDTRLKNLRTYLNDSKVGGFLVSNPYNVQYLSGFRGEASLLITAAREFLITDPRYTIQAKEEAPDYEIIVYEGTLPATLKDLLSRENIHKLGFESEYLTYDKHLKFSAQLEKVRLTPLRSTVEKLRIKKESSETEKIRKAVQIADAGFEHILGYIKPGVKESDIAAELEYFMRRKGASKTSFDTIVASGFRGALPHGIASDKLIAAGDLVVMDFGVIFDGYCSDMTRTVVVGEASREQRKIYDIVLEAQLAALDAVKPGKKCCDVDAVARNIIADYGYGDNFGHGLGHGVGLEIHESPAFNKRNQDDIEEGMVVTVEPGIYLDRLGGVRIEDMVLVTGQGCEILTSSAKKLIAVS